MSGGLFSEDAPFFQDEIFGLLYGWYTQLLASESGQSSWVPSPQTQTFPESAFFRSESFVLPSAEPAVSWSKSFLSPWRIGGRLSAGRMGVGDNLHSCPWGLSTDFKQISRVSACSSSLHKTWGLLGQSLIYCGDPWPTLWDAYSVSSDPFFLANRTSITFKITRCLTSDEVLTFPTSLVAMRDHS